MALSNFKCPNCGASLPETTRSNQIVRCPTCNAALFVSDWKIGEVGTSMSVATPSRVYRVSKLLGVDDLCSSYRCAFTVNDQEWLGMFRIANDADDNDLVQNEGQALVQLRAHGDYDEFRAFLPALLESFIYQEADANAAARHVNIITLHEHIASPDELYTLEAVRDYYTAGIDPKDMAWMWRRVLHVLGFVHRAGIMHGAALPAYIQIEPVEHKLALIGFGFSAREGEALRAISQPYAAWYPPEVFAKQAPTPALDLQLAARTMLYLIGADPLGEPIHRLLDPELSMYFRQFYADDPQQRPQDAWQALAEFDAIIEALWGARTFRPFSMPKK